MLLVGALAALFVHAWSKQQQEIRSTVRAAADEEASYMLGNLSDHLAFIARDLLDMSGRSPHHSQSDHLAGTKHLIEANPFLQAINHVGTDRRIEYVAPFEPNKQVVGLRIDIAAPREALEMAASFQRPYVSRPFEIIQGELGYSMMVPDLDGRFFEIVFRGNAVFGNQSIFRRRPDIAIRVFDGESPVFEAADYESKLSDAGQYEVGVEGTVLNRALRIDTLPGDAMFARSSEIWRTIATGSLVLSFVSLSAIVATQAFNIRRRQRAERHARRLARENEVLAEIGRIITSSMDINQVYERFGEQVRRLIPFDGIAINLVEPDGVTAVQAYMLGELLLRDGKQRDTFPLEGTVTQEVVEQRRGTYLSADGRDDMEARSRYGHVAVPAGFRSVVVVPLISGGDSIGALLMLSAETNAYTKQDLALAERVGAQISGAIANARLYTAVQRSEQRTRQLSRENEVIAEIGRIITSSMDIDEVYERFGEQVRRLIPFDRIDIVTIDLERNEMRVEYAYGLHVDAQTARRGYTRPLAGSIVEKVVRKGSGILSVPRDRDELVRENPQVVPIYDLGLLSHVSEPLVAAGKSIGMLALLSRKSQAYTKEDLRLVGRVGAQISGAIANARLYSELHRAGDALQESEERYRVLVDGLPYPIFLHSDSRVVYANPAAARLHGAVRPEELVGRSLLEFTPEEDHTQTRERMRRLYNGLPTPTVEIKKIDSDGKVRIVETMGVPVRHMGQPAAIVVERDITERKELQAQLIQSQKMQAVGQLAGGVAHDFNNLLTAILGYAYILKDTLAFDHPGHEYIDEIHAAAERAATITRQLLAFSRREAAEPTVVDLNQVVLNTIKLLQRLLGENIELVTLLSREQGMVRVDPGQMEQVLVNMAVNARDAMPAGGTLTIESMCVALGRDSAVQISELPAGRYVKLSISDTGTGMSEEVKARLFEPFFTTKEVDKGTGLGLATCHGIVKQSGGEIRVLSEPGRGSTFEVYLPHVAQVGDNRGESSGATGGTETVLVVDDEPSVRSLTVSILRQQGYTVLEASEGEEALQVARDFSGENIHVLLTDVIMPNMDGGELADSLLAQFPETKVIFTSGYPEGAPPQEPGFRPDFGFLLKPFVPSAVAAKVREVLDAPCSGRR